MSEKSVREALQEILEQQLTHVERFIARERERQILHDLWMSEHGNDLIPCQGIDDAINPSHQDPTLTTFYDPMNDEDS